MAGTRLECHRPFFAIQPPEAAQGAIAAIRDAVLGLRSLVSDDRLHMTLLMIEDVPELSDDLAAKLRMVGAAVRADAPTVVLDRLACSRANAVLVPGAGQPGLAAMQARLAEALAAVGLPVRQGWRFSPHVTLGYRPQEAASRPIDPVVWKAAEFVLLDSWVGLSRHERIGGWPLKAQDQAPDCPSSAVDPDRSDAGGRYAKSSTP